MSRFYKANTQEAKTNSTVNALQQTTTTGVALGWLKNFTGLVDIPAVRSVLDATLMTSNDPITDYRIICAVSWLSSKAWVSQKLYQNQDISDDELAEIHMGIDLLCKWKAPTPQAGGAPTPYTLQAFQGSIATLGSSLSAAAKPPMIQPFISKAPIWIVNQSVVLQLRDEMLDWGLILDIWRNATSCDDIRRGLMAPLPTAAQGITAFPTDLATFEGNLSDSLWGTTTIGAAWGAFYVWTFARTKETQIRAHFSTAACLFIVSLVKEQGPSSKWLTSRLSRIENDLELPLGTINITPSMINVFRSLSGVDRLTSNQLLEALQSLREVSNTLRMDCITWMVDQAAYTGMTAMVTMISNLSEYPEMPWGLLFTEVQDELTAFLTACMYAYRFPYSGLLKTMHPATRFPNIASAAIQIAQDLGHSSYKGYKGKFLGYSAEKTDGIVSGFQRLREAITSDDLISKYLAHFVQAKPKVTIVRGVANITVPTPQQGMNLPPNWNADFRNLVLSHDPASGLVTTDLVALLRLIRTHQETNAAGTMIGHLYSSVLALNVAFKEAPWDPPRPGTRPNPAAGSDLEGLANAVTSATWQW